MKVRLKLSIGYPTATHEDIVDIDDTEWDECETDQEKEELLDQYLNDWMWNYIDAGVEIIEELG